MTGLPTQSAENKFQTPFFKASIPAIRRKSQMDWLWNRFAPDFLQRGSFGEVCRNFQFLVNAFKPFHLHTSALYVILLLFCQMTLTQEYKEVNFDQVVAKWQKRCPREHPLLTRQTTFIHPRSMRPQIHCGHRTVWIGQERGRFTIRLQNTGPKH